MLRLIRAKRILSIRHRLHKRGARVLDEPWYLSLTENMSVLGVLFTAAAPYCENDILEIEIVMSGVLNIFKGYGRVVRVEKKESGVTFSIAVSLIDLKDKRSRSKDIPSRKNLPLKKTTKRR